MTDRNTARPADGPELGPSIRHRRRALDLTLAEVAARSGLSAPFLSQVENGRARPSMRSLQSVADALDTTAVELLAAAEPGEREVDVVRSGAASGLDPDGARPLVRGRKQLHALEFTGDHDYGRAFTHRNDEVMYVCDGSAEVEAEGRTHRLDAGDTLYCAGGVPHRWRPLLPGTRVLVVGIAEHLRPAADPRG